MRIRNSLIRSVPAEWVEPTSTTSPRPTATNSTLRRMKARITISPSSASVCTKASRCCRSSSITSPAMAARNRKSARRPDSVLTSPVNCPGAWTVTRVSSAPEGRKTSSSPETTTKKGTALSPCSTSTSPGRKTRMRPCVAMRRI